MTALAGETSSGERYSTTLSQQLLYVTVPIISGPEIHGAVRLTYPAQVVADAVDAKVRVLWLVALTTVVLAGIVAWIFSSGVTRRLRILREATERLADGRLDWHADEKSGAPELRSLSKSFNTMAARLHALIDQQRSFAADASHQLRTPLTALRLRLERARELLETDPPAAAERLAAAETEVDRLASIIEGLLMLSRTESSSAPVRPVDIAAVARERVEHWQALAQESGVGIRFEGPGSATASAVDGAAEQIIDNYVDNALIVSKPGDELVIRVREEPGAVAVHVLDQGPGMSEEELARAFDRFWRAGSTTGGSGLGLAIVSQLALASGATVALESRAAGGLDAQAHFTVHRAAPEGSLRARRAKP
jgi:signal transduction histidine kinase